MELKSFAAQAIALSSAFDMNGVDVYFLNRPTVLNVKSIAQLEEVFRKEPTDYCLTPLSNKLDQIINEKRDIFANGTGVLVIATDGNNNINPGEPRSSDGKDSVQQFTYSIKHRHSRIGLNSPAQIPISIRACTNDKNSIGYLNQIDQDPQIYVDVCDDYGEENRNISDALGREFLFTLGDYCLKCLIGSFDPWMDKLDEPSKLSFNEVNYQKYGVVPAAAPGPAASPYAQAPYGQQPQYAQSPYAQQGPPQPAYGASQQWQQPYGAPGQAAYNPQQPYQSGPHQPSQNNPGQYQQSNQQYQPGQPQINQQYQPGPPSANQQYRPGQPPANQQYQPGQPPTNQQYQPQTNQQYQPGAPPANQQYRPGQPPANQQYQPGAPPDNQQYRPGQPPANQQYQPGKPPANQQYQSGQPPANQQYQPGQPPANQQYQPGQPPANQQYQPGQQQQPPANQQYQPGQQQPPSYGARY
jgi:hypothetical protein